MVDHRTNSTRKLRWFSKRDLANAFGIAFYAGLGWLASGALLPAINRSPLDKAQSTIVCVLIGTAFGLLRAHWSDLVGTYPHSPDTESSPP